MVKNLPASTGDIRDRGSIPGSGRSPERGYGNPLQYSCLENAMDRGAWLATIHRVTRSMLSTHASFRNTGLNPLNQNSWAGTLMSACLITTADVYHEHPNLRTVFFTTQIQLRNNLISLKRNIMTSMVYCFAWMVIQQNAPQFQPELESIRTIYKSVF